MENETANAENIPKDRRSETSKANAAKAREARAAMKVEKDKLLSEHKAKLAALKEATRTKPKKSTATTAEQPVDEVVTSAQPVEEVKVADEFIEKEEELPPIEQLEKPKLVRQTHKLPVAKQVLREEDSESDDSSSDDDSEDEIVFRKVRKAPAKKVKASRPKKKSNDEDIESVVKRLMDARFNVAQTGGKAEPAKPIALETPAPAKKRLQIKQGFIPAQVYSSKIQSLLRH